MNDFQKEQGILELKKNERAFGLLPKYQQKILLTVGLENIECYVQGDYWSKKNSEQPLGEMFTYRIKSDYPPEPEIELKVGAIYIMRLADNILHWQYGVYEGQSSHGAYRFREPRISNWSFEVSSDNWTFEKILTEK